MSNGQLWKRLLTIRPEREFHIARLMQPFQYPDFSETIEYFGARGLPQIYHYTGAEGLLGILQTNRLWATSAYHLNDSSEIEYGCRLVLEVLDEWVEANRDNKVFGADVLRGLRGLFMNPLSQSFRSRTIYVACFCHRGNLLSQWRAYGQKGGYSLGFRVSINSIDLVGPPGFDDVRLVRVEYLTGNQLRKLQGIIMDFVTALGIVPVEINASSETREALIREIILWLEEVFLQEIVTFKHPAFKDEQEWRVVVRPTRLGGNYDPGQQAEVPFKFRHLRGSVVPYVELKPTDPKLPIASVHFGPTLDATRTKNPIEMLLAANGFTHVPIEGADIPVIL